MVVVIESLPLMMTCGKLRISMVVVIAIVKMSLILSRLIFTREICWRAFDSLLKLPWWITVVCSLWGRFWITMAF